MFFKGLKPKDRDCCGCGACVEICPKKALGFEFNAEGFKYPLLNPDVCIECGACEKVCPMLHSNNTFPPNIGCSYAVVNNNKHDLLHSSSGGVFSIIAKYVLQMKGLVYGAVFDDNLNLQHRGIEKIDSLTELQGSKYIQSDNNGVYKEIKNFLQQGRLIYYVGTGCQVAGLRLYLKKEYENLITSDILCHGVPPHSVFQEAISELESRYRGRVIVYKFRDKKIFGWSCSSSCLISKKKKNIYIGYDSIMNSYFNAFIKGVMNRESCYVCPFASQKRCGDITLGDYWGVENYISISDKREGVSAIIVNTKKGNKIIEMVKDFAQIYPTSISDISQINKTLISPTPRPEERDLFFIKFFDNPKETLKFYKTFRLKSYLLFRIKQNNLLKNILAQIKSYIGK